MVVADLVQLVVVVDLARSIAVVVEVLVVRHVSVVLAVVLLTLLFAVYYCWSKSRLLLFLFV